MKYKVIALVGKAGSGKDSILQGVIDLAPMNSLNEIISCTTRPPREKEINGINYYFMTDKEFDNEVAQGNMLEYTNFNNWSYGTPIKALSAEKPNIGVFNPTGIYSLMERDDIDLDVFLVEAYDKTRLIRQLKREDYPNVDEIIRRYQADQVDFKKFYDVWQDDWKELWNNNFWDYGRNVNTILDLIK